MEKAVTLLSGGMDSATMLYHLRSQNLEVHALAFDYGQRHKKELQAAARIAVMAKAKFDIVDLTSVGELFLSSANSSQTNKSVPVPDGHYAEESMKITIVPNRNAMMLGIAFAAAVAEGANIVGFAAHGGDHFIYPDCRPEFIESYLRAMQFGNDNFKLHLVTFASMDKTWIAHRGHELGVPFEETWSCYKGGLTHCGTCGTCTERKEAFLLAGLDDPTEYDE